MFSFFLMWPWSSSTQRPLKTKLYPRKHTPVLYFINLVSERSLLHRIVTQPLCLLDLHLSKIFTSVVPKPLFCSLSPNVLRVLCTKGESRVCCTAPTHPDLKANRAHVAVEPHFFGIRFDETNAKRTNTVCSTQGCISVPLITDVRAPSVDCTAGKLVSYRSTIQTWFRFDKQNEIKAVETFSMMNTCSDGPRLSELICLYRKSVGSCLNK